MAPKIMLDAGHTGKYWNKGAVAGYYESAIMWKLHNYLAEELENRGFAVGKTRKSIDTDMDVVARGKMAKGNDLFLSLHSNSCDDPNVRRVVCIYQTEDSAGTWDTTSKAISDKLAATVADVMSVTWKNYSKLSANDRNGDGKKNDNYYGVLHGARLRKVPGIIVEHSFHSNPETCNWLMKDANLRKLAQAEADCLADHFGITVQKLPTHEKPEEYLVRVKVNNLRIRKGPGTNYGKAGTIKPGTYTIVDESTGKGADLWGKLKSGAGWIALDYTERVKDEQAATFTCYNAKVTPANGLNVRAGASIEHKKLGALNHNAKITILAEKDGFGRISYNGGTGWVSLQYVKKV